MAIPLAQVGTDVGAGIVRFVGSRLFAVSAGIFGLYAFRNLQLNDWSLSDRSGAISFLSGSPVSCTECWG
ncbi:hypothetical protein ACFFQF_26365 [Haladaptatus pallidirubidus]|uniref:Uncharacterized protein n=1 Tax=Haladaptatus pallidirubidus TaxID=1008152 RepID=A0AAV3UNB3_9EURY|nr:hypothetical protein [Haladaptatus pallidirubidus]